MGDISKTRSTPDQSPLGKAASYVDQYDPELLFPLPRASKREELGLGSQLPFFGADMCSFSFVVIAFRRCRRIRPNAVRFSSGRTV